MNMKEQRAQKHSHYTVKTEYKGRENYDRTIKSDKLVIDQFVKGSLKVEDLKRHQQSQWERWGHMF